MSTKLYKFKYYHEVSLVKTIAHKEKISCKSVYKKYGVNVKLKQGTRQVIGVSFMSKGKEKQLTYFNDSIKRCKVPDTAVQDFLITNMSKGKQLIQRLNSNKCELCGLESDKSSDFSVHHVRKLKDIKDKYSKKGRKVPTWVLYMSKINRKTLIVCHKCHWDIHRGNVKV